MIDFRYHLVSIVAVFLALGLGLLVGATALQPTALGGLIRLSQQERKQIDSALATNRQLSRQIAANDQFAQSVAPQLLDQLLAGERVVVVEAPGASGQVISGVDQALAQAGAAVSGHVQLQNKFFDTSPSTEQQLSQLAQQFAPPGASLHGSPVAQASQVIAGAILTKDGPGQPVAGQRDAASVALLSGFGAGGFLNVTGHPDARATLAVVILPGHPAVHEHRRPAEPAAGHVRAAAEPGRPGHGRGRLGGGLGAGQRDRCDAERRPGRPSVQRR